MYYVRLCILDRVKVSRRFRYISEKLHVQGVTRELVKHLSLNHLEFLLHADEEEISSVRSKISSFQDAK